MSNSNVSKIEKKVHDVILPQFNECTLGTALLN